MRRHRDEAGGETSRSSGSVSAVVTALTLLPALVCLGTMGACASADGTSVSQPGRAQIVADTGFLADIVQNVAGDRFSVTSLVPPGSDPHSFEPTPQDAVLMAKSEAVVINVAGLIPAIDELVAGAGDDGPLLIEAAAGLGGAAEDPHLWLDPVNVITYATNIADGLALVDPKGADVYQISAQSYSDRLRELDAWIAAEVESMPAARRLLVTNHQSLGYFAQRYGFTIVGTVFPTTTGEGSPSARQMAELISAIEESGAPAIFLETGSNPDLAEQVARETGAIVVTDLQTNSLDEDAPTYIDMMRWNVDVIVEALR